MATVLGSALGDSESYGWDPCRIKNPSNMPRLRPYPMQTRPLESSVKQGDRLRYVPVAYDSYGGTFGTLFGMGSHSPALDCASNATCQAFEALGGRHSTPLSISGFEKQSRCGKEC